MMFWHEYMSEYFYICKYYSRNLDNWNLDISMSRIYKLSFKRHTSTYATLDRYLDIFNNSNLFYSFKLYSYWCTPRSSQKTFWLRWCEHFNIGIRVVRTRFGRSAGARCINFGHWLCPSPTIDALSGELSILPGPARVTISSGSQSPKRAAPPPETPSPPPPQKKTPLFNCRVGQHRTPFLGCYDSRYDRVVYVMSGGGGLPAVCHSGHRAEEPCRGVSVDRRVMGVCRVFGTFDSVRARGAQQGSHCSRSEETWPRAWEYPYGKTGGGGDLNDNDDDDDDA